MAPEQTSLDSIVSCSHDVMSGTPVFRGTRVPIKNLLDYLSAGDSLDEFLAQFPTVKREQALSLLAFAEELVLARIGHVSPR
jgi:uncharacterized protein (DUF433 family)